MLAGVIFAQAVGASALEIRSDSVTICGEIRGFVADSAGVAMTVTVSDIVLGQSCPYVIPVGRNGKFCRNIPIKDAQFADIRIEPHNLIGVYLEPSSDLAIEFNNDDLVRDSSRGRDLTLKADFGGSLGRINRELAAAPTHDRISVWAVDERTSPAELKDSIVREYDRRALELENYIATLPADSRAPRLLRGNMLAEKVLSLFDYADFNKSHAMLPQQYYEDFVVALLYADESVLASSDAAILLNRLGYTKFLPSMRYPVKVGDLRRTREFLTGRGATFTADEEKLLACVPMTLPDDAVVDVTMNDFMWINHALFSAADRMNVREEFTEQLNQSLGSADILEADAFDKKKAADSELMRKLAGTSGDPLIFQYAVCARDWQEIMEAEPDSLDACLDFYGISAPELRRRLKQLYADLRNRGNELPDNMAGRYMRQLIEPFRGKYLLVDFWDLYCGPCRAGIESNAEWREANRNNPDFDILFLASEDSPLDGLTEYTQKHLRNDHTMRLSRVGMGMLRELFNFNAIPRYVFFDREGRIINPDSSIWEFKDFLKSRGLAE